ncbi:MAG: porin, partial [Chitinophagaceae bacterium]
MFIRLYETKRNLFSLTTGVFARPFGFEVNLSSSYRETPERGRMSQELVPSERDLGAMVSYEPQRKTARNRYIRIDAGIFNGPGLAGTGEIDNVKDVIGRIILKPLRIGKFELSGSIGQLHGGWRQVSKYVYKDGNISSGDKAFIVDSSLTNAGKTAPRQYYGADMQLKWLHKKTVTEIRGECWTGKQSGTPITSVSPGTLPTGPTFIRKFNGAFFYFIQDIISSKTQLLVKYDWYDPNSQVAKKEIGKPGTLLNEGDIKYSTLGLGLSRIVTGTVKLILYYEIVTNESTILNGYTHDLKDNLLTCRLQFRF